MSQDHPNHHTTRIGEALDPHIHGYGQQSTTAATAPSNSIQAIGDNVPSNQPSNSNATDVEQAHHRTGAEIEQDLKSQGKMPGLKEAGPEHREAGQEDEAGNKIHHHGMLGRLLHGEHSSANADRP